MNKFSFFFQKYWLIILLLVGVISGLGVFLLIKSTDTKSPSVKNMAVLSDSKPVTSTSGKEKAAKKPAIKQYVEIKGAVVRPGIYPIQPNMRLAAVLSQAGGPNANADLKKINLAKIVQDQESFYIPQKGEVIAKSPNDTQINAETANETAPSAGQKDQSLVNLNVADLNKLQTLDGIGQKKAEKIIEYRRDHGNFKEISDLKKISGIGDKIFEAIKTQITVGN